MGVFVSSSVGVSVLDLVSGQCVGVSVYFV